MSSSWSSCNRCSSPCSSRNSKKTSFRNGNDPCWANSGTVIGASVARRPLPCTSTCGNKLRRALADIPAWAESQHEIKRKCGQMADQSAPLLIRSILVLRGFRQRSFTPPMTVRPLGRIVQISSRLDSIKCRACKKRCGFQIDTSSRSSAASK